MSLSLLIGQAYKSPMQRLQAFKFELMPNGEQQRDMRRFAGSCRFVYNKALAMQKENYEADGKFIGYVAMAKQLTAWRNGTETSWLKEAPGPSPATRPQRPGAGVQQFLRQTRRLSALQKKGTKGELPLPRSQAIQDRRGQRAHLPAEARLDAPAAVP